MKTIFITSYFTLIALIGNTQITDKNHIVNRDKNGIITSVDFNYSSTISDTATPSNPCLLYTSRCVIRDRLIIMQQRVNSIFKGSLNFCFIIIIIHYAIW